MHLRYVQIRVYIKSLMKLSLDRQMYLIITFVLFGVGWSNFNREQIRIWECRIRGVFVQMHSEMVSKLDTPSQLAKHPIFYNIGILWVNSMGIKRAGPRNAASPRV